MAELFLGGMVDPATHERTGDDVRIGTDTFTTHGVIVGMTGSGKTGLGVVLIEEVLRAGLPALLIDPKGDLTNLCLTFPDLRPADFRPWIDDAQAKAAGVSPDEFAAQQAETWTEGLAGWGIGPADIAALRAPTDFTIYTPGSQSGVPINIVGSLQVPADTSDAEIVGDEIEGYVSGLLGLVGIEADPLSSREHILLSNLIAHSWQRGSRRSTCRRWSGMIAQPPIRKLGVFELDQFFPPDDRMALAMKLNGLLASPSFAAWGMGAAARHPVDAVHRRRHGPLRDRHDRPPVRRGAPVRHVAGAVQARHVDASPERHHRPAGAALHGRGRRLPAADRQPADEEADHDADEAGACVRRRRRAVDAEPGRRRLQGDVQRRHVDDRPAADRARQAAPARRHELGAAAASTSPRSATRSPGSAKREFVLRRAGKDHPEVFTTRWAMSYLRGPMTRTRSACLMRPSKRLTPPTDEPGLHR